MDLDTAAATRTYTVGGVERPRPFAVQRLGHSALYQRDLAAALTFYRDLLGFRVTDTLPHGAQGAGVIAHFLTHNSDHHSFLLMDAAFGAQRDGRYNRGITLNQLSFQVGALQEVVDGGRFVEEHCGGLWRIGRDVPGSNWAVYALDPDGHPVELFYGMEQIGWDRRSKPIGAVPPVAGDLQLPQRPEWMEVEAAVAAGVDLAGGAASIDPLPPRFDVGGVLLARPFKIVDIGPIGLFVDDLEASVRWYHDIYGLPITERTTIRGHEGVFLRAGAGHHAVSLFPVALREELGFPARSTVATVGMRVANYAQLRDAVAFLRDAGVEVRTDVERGMHAGMGHVAWVIDPDGHRLALYCSMERIGWDGRPRPAESRPSYAEPWPSTVAERDDDPAPAFFGPLA